MKKLIIAGMLLISALAMSQEGTIKILPAHIEVQYTYSGGGKLLLGWNYIEFKIEGDVETYINQYGDEMIYNKKDKTIVLGREKFFSITEIK